MALFRDPNVWQEIEAAKLPCHGVEDSRMIGGLAGDALSMMGRVILVKSIFSFILVFLMMNTDSQGLPNQA